MNKIYAFIICFAGVVNGGQAFSQSGANTPATVTPNASSPQRFEGTITAQPQTLQSVRTAPENNAGKSQDRVLAEKHGSLRHTQSPDPKNARLNDETLQKENVARTAKEMKEKKKEYEDGSGLTAPVQPKAPNK